MTSDGVVSDWSADEGWGVILSPDTPGGCWAHFSSVTMEGFRSLAPGSLVDFVWEKTEQDGFDYRAVTMIPKRDTT